jgi:hypothetical protein
MSTVAFIAVIISALLHSGYNLLIKVSDEKTLYMWSIFSVAVIAGWVAGCLMVPFRRPFGRLFHILPSLRCQGLCCRRRGSFPELSAHNTRTCLHPLLGLPAPRGCVYDQSHSRHFDCDGGHLLYSAQFCANTGSIQKSWVRK